ncbi:MAG: apocytochrome f [Candidatus Synechococcus spongiarum 142]|uniref:Cytochrome f n=1 Tax=Candidatus Synechococcus spongiarum 142 TaxID=1608213 RepID=A0A6N3XCT9_9SYNE|nr:MAG: apocytochrome f [Candidatus Synechococcus spongiarum 142]
MHPLRALVVGLLLACLTLFVQPDAAQAYPFWAQQVAPETPREATGKLVCANCHLAQKPIQVETPQAVFPDTVFKATVKVPYETGALEVAADGSQVPLQVGAVLMLPDGFHLAPEDRIPDALKEEMEGIYYSNYNDSSDNVILVGPLPGDQHQELVFPVLSPNPAEDSAITFGKYAVHVGGNRGRGQLYPTGEKSNNGAWTADVAGEIIGIDGNEDGSHVVHIATEAGTVVDAAIPAGLQVTVAPGDTVAAGAALTNDPNQGGFGQRDTEIVLQSPWRILSMLGFFTLVLATQIFFVLKKRQVERVQAAGQL